jgi:hypothetical protein
MNKKVTCIVIYLFIAVIAVGVLYWNFRIRQEKLKLTAIADIYQKACNSQIGCIEIPVGWERNIEGGYSKGQMIYSSKQDRFTLKKHIATDVYIVATGGKNIPLNVVRNVE